MQFKENIEQGAQTGVVNENISAISPTNKPSTTQNPPNYDNISPNDSPIKQQCTTKSGRQTKRFIPPSKEKSPFTVVTQEDKFHTG